LAIAQAVLGIDAAWTANQPSGVALVVRDGRRWRLEALAPSYQHFLGAAPQEARPVGSPPEPGTLLAAASKLCNGAVDLVAVDMPLARSPICKRRASDLKISRDYGARHCATHSPSAERPGKISDKFTRDFASAGYPLQTEEPVARGVIEVYPHPALIELTGAAKRLEYKVARAGRYWPSLKPAERRERLFAKWMVIADALEAEISGVKARLPKWDHDATGVQMKAHEDMLDAIVCAWVGICALEGRAQPHGDGDSAIWIPQACSETSLGATLKESASAPPGVGSP
jgi:predicted RNase H-like nuclease